MSAPRADDFDRISPTAFMTSLGRQFTDIPYSGEFARLVTAQRLNTLPIILEARYKAIDDALARYQPTQILELASGFLPRGLAMSLDPAVTYVESDLPPMVRAKREIVQKIVGERSNLHFVEIDATSRPSQFSSIDDYFSQERPVAIVCEGLLMYLTLAEKQRVCASVLETLQRFGGVWITCDFTATAGLRLSAGVDPGLRQRMEAVTHITGRSLAENAFESVEQSQAFIREQGFQVEDREVSAMVEQLSCLEVLGLSSDVARKILAGRTVSILTPT